MPFLLHRYRNRGSRRGGERPKRRSTAVAAPGLEAVMSAPSEGPCTLEGVKEAPRLRASGSPPDTEGPQRAGDVPKVTQPVVT